MRVLEAQRRAGGRVETLRDFGEDLCGEAGARMHSALESGERVAREINEAG